MASKKKTTAPVDSDFDGIPDATDPTPYQFDVTTTNGGKLQGGPNAGKQGFQASVQPIQLPGVNRPPSVAEAKDWFTYLSHNNPSVYAEMTKNLTALGIPKKDWQKAWDKAVDWTQSLGANSGDPRQYFASLTASDFTTAGQTQYGTTKFSTKNTTEYSPSSAATDVQRTFRSEMGQEGTQTQVDAYTKAVNAAAAKSPSVTTGVTTTAPGVSNTVQKSTTGFDPTEFARNFVKSQPQYAENFVASNAMGLISKLLNDPNAIGTVVQ